MISREKIEKSRLRACSEDLVPVQVLGFCLVYVWSSPRFGFSSSYRGAWEISLWIVSVVKARSSLDDQSVSMIVIYYAT